MSLINLVRSFLNPLKIDLVKYPNLDLRRREKLLSHHKITKILDVGANSGQYALQTFKLGYKGEIVSFEPVNSTFKNLEKKAIKNKNWKVFNYGLGDKEEELEINISENSYSSSLLDIMPSHLKSAPESKIVGKEVVVIKTLDAIFNNFVLDDEVVLLKLDVQGFEKNVLEGAIKSLKNIHGIQIEMSVEELYSKEMLYLEMTNYITSLGYNLYSLENGFYDENSGKLLQVDGVFFR
ncbi:MAG: FkbM family methyltransferase [Polaribacter sp.]|uniref:FkbM family methyltransferase n=1 Tax=Polaribacter sp. TaxID=1920175 RepID=UPI002F358FBD